MEEEGEREPREWKDKVAHLGNGDVMWFGESCKGETRTTGAEKTVTYHLSILF